MANRYFAPQLADVRKKGNATGWQVQLDANETHHLLHVMRADVGQTVSLFDGQGGEYVARIDEVTRKSCLLAVLEVRSGKPLLDASASLTLAVALPRGDRQQWLVEKATELNVTHIACWSTKRSAAHVSAKTIDRLRRTVIAACKQCGRNWLTELSGPLSFDDMVRSEMHMQRLLAVLPSQSRNVVALSDALDRRSAGGPCVVGIGPEGGFTSEEIDLALAHKWQPVSLGQWTLRSETAALAIATAFRL